jgi:hypothetical protein
MLLNILVAESKCDDNSRDLAYEPELSEVGLPKQFQHWLQNQIWRGPGGTMNSESNLRANLSHTRYPMPRITIAG